MIYPTHSTTRRHVGRHTLAGALPGFLLTIAATFHKEHRHAISH